MDKQKLEKAEAKAREKAEKKLLNEANKKPAARAINNDSGTVSRIFDPFSRNLIKRNKRLVRNKQHKLSSIMHH